MRTKIAAVLWKEKRLMEIEVEGLTGAAHGERNAERLKTGTVRYRAEH